MKRNLFFAFVLLFTMMSSIFAQVSTITGTVTSKEDGASLPGVNVLVKGTHQGTVTDANGKYSIALTKENAVLQFSFIGYLTQEFPVSGTSTIDVVLSMDVLGLEEVVVTGYGTQKKENLTGAVEVVSSETLENRPVANVAQAIQGVVPNLNISNTNLGGEPGATQSWNIRGVGSLTGNDSPYFLVDGVPMSINNVNPEDIESVTVLKDAAASAIYGSRAPYGVVLITTKKGKKNEGVSFTYTNNFAWSKPTIIPKQQNSRDFVDYYNDGFKNAGMAPYFDDEWIQRIEDHQAGLLPEAIVNPDDNTRYLSQANNDWMDIYYNHYAFRQKHDFSLKGGGENTTYYVSAGIYDQGGQLRWGDEYYKRYNITANISSKVTDWLKFDFSTKYTRGDIQNPQAWAGYGYSVMWHQLSRQWPTSALYNEHGDIIDFTTLLFAEGGKIRTLSNDSWTTLAAELEPVKGWVTRATYNFNIYSSTRMDHRKQVFGTRADGTKYSAAYPLTEYRETFGNNIYQMFNVTSSYSRSIGEHNLFLMLGYEQELQQNSGLWGYKKALVTDAVPSISTATGDSYIDDSKSHWATQGVFGRFTYNFKGKYLFEFNARYDGSSRFASGKRHGFFPSGSVGYHLSKEGFWDPISNIINDFKIRASYGSLGNQNVPNYLYVNILPVRTNLSWIMGGSRPVYTLAPGLISPSLTWETSTTTDIGLDAAFLNRRLSLVFDYYDRVTSNMFGPAESLPSVLGTSPPQENNAKLGTKGFEVSLKWADKIGSDLRYNVRFTLANSVSTVLEYSNPTKYLGNWREGEEIGEIWGLTSGGFFQDDSEVDDWADQSLFYKRWQAGDMKYVDTDGDGEITRGDWTEESHGDYSIIGNNSPKYAYGITGGLTWKGLDLNIFLQGVAKRDIMFSRYTNVFWGFRGNMWQNSMYQEHLDYWRPADYEGRLGPNTDAYYPRNYISGEHLKNTQPQTKYLQNGAYMRLKNLQIGYTLKSDWTKKVAIQRARIYFSGENLLTFTKLSKLFDPEALGGGWGSGKIYPLAKLYSLGVNITF